MSSLSKELSALGPSFQVTETIVVQKTSDLTVPLTLYNPMRWALVIGITSGTISVPGIALSVATLAAKGGWLLENSGGVGGNAAQPIVLWFRDHGPLVSQQWFGGSTAGSFPSAQCVWTVYEVILPPV